MNHPGKGIVSSVFESQERLIDVEKDTGKPMSLISSKIQNSEI